MTSLPGKEIFEIEQKLRVQDLAEAIKYFEQERATFVKTDHIQDFYYDTTTHALFRQGRVLKLRKQSPVRPYSGETALSLTVKSQTKVHEVRNEIEIPVEDLSNTQRFISLLGFNEIAQVNKVRSEYHLDQVKILFDAGVLGNFIEIEILSSDPETSTQTIQNIIDQLPFSYDKEPFSYLQLALEYKRKKKEEKSKSDKKRKKGKE